MTSSAKKSAFLFAVTSLLVAAFAVLGKCAYDRHVRQIDSEAMRLGIEDVSRRIRVAVANLSHITELYNESAISAARTFAKIVAINPSVIHDRDTFLELKRALGVDELHVSDSRGVLIASEPTNSFGYAMASRAQSAAFMPAITNKEFELVQRPMIKGVEKDRLFQYAGVARIDEPGIVQIGLEPSRLENATSIADIDNIAANVRVGRGGRVSIIKLERSAGSDERVIFDVAESGDGRIASMQTDSDGYRIVITMPYRGWWLADDVPYRVLCTSVVALIILVLLGGLNMFGRRGFMRLLADFKMLFEPVAKRAHGYRIGPVVIIAFAVFALGTIIAFAVASKVQLKRAREVMLAGEADFIEDFNAAPDGCLFFVGNAFTSYYETPKKASEMDVRDLMSMYGIDELNIVDRNGKVLRGDLANVGFDFHSNATAAQFLCLLDSKNTTFSQNFRGAIENPKLRRKYAGVAFPAHDGFVQIGFDEARIESNFDYRLSVLAQDRSVGDRGFCVLAKRDGQIVSSGRPEFEETKRRGEVSTLAGIDFDVTLIPEDEGSFFEAVLYRERCLCLSRPLGQYHRLIVATPLAAVARERNVTVIFVGALLLVIIGLGAVFGTRLSNLVSMLKTFIADDTRRRAEELRNATAIQIESLPRIFPDTPVYKIYARMDTAKAVGGDFYDFYTLPSGKQLFLIADTSGKGIPAAMFMMKAKAVIRAGMFEAPDLATAVFEVNDRLSEYNDANMFVTAWIGVFDPETLEVQFVNCGHNPPLIKHADGSVTWVRTRPGLALAAMPGVRYRVEKISLVRGESLFLYTDGTTEAMNSSGEQYGEKRLESDLIAAPCFKFVEHLRKKVSEFVAGAEQSDDITMLSLDCK